MSLQSIYLVARREVTERVRARAYLITTGLMIIGVIGLVAILSVATADGVDEVTVAGIGDGAEHVIEAAAERGEDVELEIRRLDFGSREAAESAIANGELDAAVVTSNGPTGTEILVDERASASLAPYLEQVASAVMLDTELQAAGLTPDEITGLMQGVGVVATEVAREDSDTSGAGIAFVATILLYIAIVSAGYTVSSGVVEEKGTRVVELLLNTVKAKELLAGKVVGIGLVGLMQFGAVVAVGFVALTSFGTIDVPDAAGSTALLAVVCFVLGYIFYGCAFAAAGAIVSRQEDSNSTTSPLMILLIGSYIVSFNVLDNPDSGFAQLLSYLPVSAPIVLPAREAAGALPFEQLLIALACLIAGCALLIWAAGRIYERAVLRMGAPLKIRETLTLLRR